MTIFKSNRDAYRHGAKTLPAEFFTSPEIFNLEREKIYQHYWVCLGHESKLARGEYYLQNVMGDNLIVLRDYQDVVRVFFNTCRHRGSVLCQEPSGKLANSIVCEYHNWTYALDGKLIGAPGMKNVLGFSFDENGMRRVPLEICEGFMFINLSRGEVEPFAVQYAPMIERLQSWDMGELQIVHSAAAVIRANHKMAKANFHECLHCPASHKLFNTFVNYTNAAHDLTEGPFLGGYMDIKDGESVTMSRKMCALPMSAQESQTTRRGWYYTAEANWLINKHPEYIMNHHLFPISPNETLVVSEWLFSKEAIGRPDFHPEEAIEIWSITNAEDWHPCEINQRGIESGGYQPGWYAENESILIAFDDQIRKVLGR